MKKILFTASTYSHIHNFHLPYLQSFQDNGWEVHIASGDLPEQVSCANKVIELPFEKKMFSPSNFRAALLTRKAILEEKYSIVCTHTSLAAFFTRLALVGMWNRPKLINMVHGYLFDDDTQCLKKKVLLAAERLMAPYTDLLLTMNTWDYETAKRYQLGKRVGKVPGIGVDFSRLSKSNPDQRRAKRQEMGIPEDAVVLFYAAEFSKRKSQNVLIDAMQYLHDNVYLVLAGNGVLLEQCKEQAGALGVKNRVVFPGYVRDIGVWYGIADVAVTSSRSEGLPFNVMEAMYARIPVVASMVKGHQDLVEEEQTGLLYPHGDAKACARQVTRLIGSPILREKLIQEAGEKVLQYDLENVLPVVMKQYLSDI